MDKGKAGSIHLKETLNEMEVLFDESWQRTWQVNRLVAMVKEPFSIFVYWEVTDIRKQLICEHFQSDWASLPFFLQVYDVTQVDFNGFNANASLQIPVDPISENWYVHGLIPGHIYQVDFGTTTLQGKFFTILRSNLVETPRISVHHAKEPAIRFGRLHTSEHLETNKNLHSFAHLQTTEKQSSLQKEKENQQTKENRPVFFQTSCLNEPWQDQFDGYSMPERKEGF